MKETWGSQTARKGKGSFTSSIPTIPRSEYPITNSFRVPGSPQATLSNRLKPFTNGRGPRVWGFRVSRPLTLKPLGLSCPPPESWPKPVRWQRCRRRISCSLVRQGCGIWEFPKIGDPNIVPQLVGSSL